MQPEKEYVALDDANIWLGRSTINHHDQIQLPQQHARITDKDALQRDPGQHAESGNGQSRLDHLRSSMNERTHNAATKLKKTLRMSTDLEDADSGNPLLADSNTEDTGSRLVRNLPIPDKLTLKDLAHDPVGTIKSKVSRHGNQQVAANVVTKEIPHGVEVDLLNAQTAVQRAKTEADKLAAIEDVHELMKERQKRYIRWTLDRHVTKVRILPRDTFVKKTKSEFERKNAQGNVVTDWKAYGLHLTTYAAHQYGGQYIGYGSNPPPPSKESIMPNIERLIVASTPFQEFLMTTRRVYLWENRAETAKYLAIYVILWTLNLLLPGALTAVLYFIIERRMHGNSLEDLRQDVERIEDVHETALTLTEFIQKRGDEHWADDLLEWLGPWLMVQLADLANFFETMRNFYEWRVPSRTIFSLSLLATAIFISTFTPTWLLVKCMTMLAGISFFGIFPIAATFPEYRLLASPAKRLLWNIPTHAEWSIRSIQAEGSRYQQEHTSPSSSTPAVGFGSKSDGSDDYGFFTAHHNHTTGHLIISAASLRFVSNIGHKIHWTLQYAMISNIEKIDRVVGKNIPKPTTDSGKDLRFINKAGTEWVLMNVDQRDLAFSQIIGFSNTKWQVVW